MSTKTKTEKAEAKGKPALHIQVGGLRIPIWKNVSEDSIGVYYKAGQPELSYKGADGNWRTAKSYGPRDLINLIKAAAMAHSEITRRNRVAPPPAQDPTDIEDVG